jgi:gamma-glutamyl phosphate reductase
MRKCFLVAFNLDDAKEWKNANPSTHIDAIILNEDEAVRQAKSNTGERCVIVFTSTALNDHDYFNKVKKVFDI